MNPIATTPRTGPWAHAQDVLLERLPEHLDRLSWSAERIAAHQRDALRAMLAHAVVHAPFHAERLAGLDPTTVELEDLARLPVMTKAEMMARYDDVVTDRRVTRAVVEDALAATGDVPVALPGGGVAMASGGSSGERGVFAYTLPALADYLLGMVRPGVAVIDAFGGPPPGGVAMGFVAASSAVHATRALGAVFSGDVIRVHPVPATDPLPRIVTRLNEIQPLLLQSYPSLLTALADEKRAGRLAIAPLAVTGTSESFAPETKASVADAFGVWPSDQFGSTEGLVGISTAGEEAIELATDLAIVELVDGEGRPVPPGTPSSRVLVTTLLNPLQPLVRYELTDRMVAQPPAPGNGRLRVLVEGRSDDVLVWGPVRVHPLAVRSVLVTTPSVREYQVHQTAHGVHALVVPTAPVDHDELRERLADALARAGLAAPRVTTEEVDAIARHAETGKARRFVPLR